MKLLLQELLQVRLIQLLVQSGTGVIGVKKQVRLTQEQKTGEKDAEYLQETVAMEQAPSPSSCNVNSS